MYVSSHASTLMGGRRGGGGQGRLFFLGIGSETCTAAHCSLWDLQHYAIHQANPEAEASPDSTLLRPKRNKNWDQDKLSTAHLLFWAVA